MTATCVELVNPSISDCRHGSTRTERGREGEIRGKLHKPDNSSQFTAETRRAPRFRRGELENLSLPLSAFPRRSPRLCGELRTVIYFRLPMKLARFAPSFSLSLHLSVPPSSWLILPEPAAKVVAGPRPPSAGSARRRPRRSNDGRKRARAAASGAAQSARRRRRVGGRRAQARGSRLPGC